jgi:hypothetical protein
MKWCNQDPERLVWYQLDRHILVDKSFRRMMADDQMSGRQIGYLIVSDVSRWDQVRKQHEIERWSSVSNVLIFLMLTANPNATRWQLVDARRSISLIVDGTNFAQTNARLLIYTARAVQHIVVCWSHKLIIDKRRSALHETWSSGCWSSWNKFTSAFRSCHTSHRKVDETKRCRLDNGDFSWENMHLSRRWRWRRHSNSECTDQLMMIM